MTTYRWDNAHEWLTWALGEEIIGEDDLLNIILKHVQSDQIQDELQADMEETGYFDPLLGRCKDCDEYLDLGEGYECFHCHEWFHATCNDGMGGYKLEGGATVCWGCAIEIGYDLKTLESL